jgi:ubiquinone/menaquinone biosynthesis C-methylase UbiE
VIPTIRNFIRHHLFRPGISEKDPAEAYDIWAENYDRQPGNLMLDLDERLFGCLACKEIIENKAVADIGCGTGRHWGRIFQMRPQSLTGFDVSEGMLNKLREKFPATTTHKIADDLFCEIESGSFDTILSTLTIAHIENLEAALDAWSRILKPEADIIITDFHPNLLAIGGKRTFPDHNVQVSVRNFVHPVNSVKNYLRQHGFSLITEQELIIDQQVKHYYARQNALKTYQQFKGFPVIYGLHLRRTDGPE